MTTYEHILLKRNFNKTKNDTSATRRTALQIPKILPHFEYAHYLEEINTNRQTEFQTTEEALMHPSPRETHKGDESI